MRSSHVTENLKKVLTELNRVSSGGTRLLAVSKFHGPELILEAFEAGQRQFGENYVQELKEKAAVLPSEIEWHFIGHLQSNKVATLLDIPNLKRISSVDTVALADKLEKACENKLRRVEILVQLHASGEETKSGARPETAFELIKHVIERCPHLDFRGLMTIGHLSDSKITLDCFRELTSLRERCMAELGCDPTSFELSMGMSNDMDDAIRYGSTQIRIGTAIFGARNSKVQT